MDPFETYKMFVAIKSHFTVKGYDYFKYNGKTKNITVDSFNARHDKHFFKWLSKKIDSQDMQDFLVANILSERMYINHLIDEEAHDCFIQYRKRHQSLSFNFENDLDKIILHAQILKNAFKFNTARYPAIIELYLNRTISLETLCILNHYTKFVNKFDSSLSNDFLWGPLSQKIKKYTPFITFDHDRLKHVLKKRVEENPDPERSSLFF